MSIKVANKKIFKNTFSNNHEWNNINEIIGKVERSFRLNLQSAFDIKIMMSAWYLSMYDRLFCVAFCLLVYRLGLVPRNEAFFILKQMP